MKAVVWHDVGKVSIDDVPEPRIQEPADAIVRITTSAICGTDLHFVRGTMAGMRPGTVLGHEAVGVVEETGPMVRDFNVGDRVVIPSTIGCGSCVYCRAGYYAQCDNANPNGRDAGTAFYGGPAQTGPFDGLQATCARVPFAHTNLVAIPPGVSDEQERVAPRSAPAGGQWEPGDAPSLALRWATQAVAKAGTLGIIGVYPPQHESFPIGAAMNRNLTVKMGNCNHRKYVPGLLSKIAAGSADPPTVWTQQETIPTAPQAYEAFDRRDPGWTKVTLEVG